MCGRYTSTKSIEELVREFEVEAVDVGEALKPDYNVAPTKKVYAVLNRAEGADDKAPDAPIERRLTEVKWGLVPFWAKDAKVGYKMINARLETAHEKPAYRRAFRRRRCLLPADGYYEWYTPEGGASDSAGSGSGKGGGKAKGVRKQPFFIRPKDGGTLALAGLYEIWRDPQKAEEDPDRFLWTCTILTTSAEDAVGRIHDRAPLTMAPEAYADWLDPRVDDPDRVRDLLVPAAPGLLDAFPVSTLVNSVRNNGPELIEPVPAEEALF